MDGQGNLWLAAKVVVDPATNEAYVADGDGGRQPGQFFGVHNLAVDSAGNLSTTETYTGARLQRFIYKGIGPVARNQGVPWPETTEASEATE